MFSLLGCLLGVSSACLRHIPLVGTVTHVRPVQAMSVQAGIGRCGLLLCVGCLRTIGPPSIAMSGDWLGLACAGTEGARDL